jgi:hypothetical protein
VSHCAALPESVGASSSRWLPEAVARSLARRHGLELADVRRVASLYRDDPRRVAPPSVLSELPVRTPGGDTVELGELGAWTLGNELDLFWEHRHLYQPCAYRSSP